MPYDPQQRRAAIAAFSKAHKLKIFPWGQAAGLAEATLRSFMAGRNHTLSDETYERLADAASEKLKRHVTSGELRGDKTSVPVPVGHYVGAGALLTSFQDDPAIDHIAAPPDMSGGAAVVVRGDSGQPIYDDGDVLFYARRTRDPEAFINHVVILQVIDGPLLLKRLLRGTRKNRWHLVSINPSSPMLEDQAIEWAAVIHWVKKALPAALARPSGRQFGEAARSFEAAPQPVQPAAKKNGSQAYLENGIDDVTIAPLRGRLIRWLGNLKPPEGATIVPFQPKTQ